MTLITLGIIIRWLVILILLVVFVKVIKKVLKSKK